MNFYPKNEWNYQSLEDILTLPQLLFLEDWLSINKLKFYYYDDDMVNCVTVYAKYHNKIELYSIDFIRLRKSS